MAVVKIYFFVIIVLLGFEHASGQSINGKVIYVSSTEPMWIKFRSRVINYNFEKGAQTLFETRPIGDKNIQLTCVNPDFKPAKFYVYEGDNTHMFILKYKEKLSNNESRYDLSTRTLLEEAAKRTQDNTGIEVKNEQVQPAPVANNVQAQPEKAKEPEVSKPTQKEINDRFFDIKIKANKAFSGGKYDEAKDLYQQALTIKPDDVWCTGQLNEIENRKTAGIKTAQQKMAAMAYQRHITTADSAYNKKNIDLAKQEYNLALKEDPGASYPQSQLNRIELDAKNESYNDFMKIGRDYMASQSFDKAELAFNEALKLKPNDPEAKKELGKLSIAKTARDKELQKNNLRTSIQNQYNDTLAMADNMFDAGMFAEARKKYDKANKILPGQPYPSKRIVSIDSILAKQKTNIGKMKLDSANTARYTSEVEKGDKAFGNKDYKNARIAFEQAQKIKPEEKYPAERLSAIDVMVSQAGEAKKTEAAQKALQDNENNKLKLDAANTARYTTEIAKGDKAFENKDYKNARIAFEQAQKIKPEEKYPAERLSAIDVMVSQAGEEKKAETARKALTDSINKHYKTAVDRGTAAIKKEDYNAAKDFFLKAKDLKPGENLPATQLVLINKKLDEIQTEDRYDTFLTLGDSTAFTARDLKGSRRWYDSARALKPNETRAKKQLLSINQTIYRNDSIAAEQQGTKLRTGKYNEVFAKYLKADTDRLEKKYPEAYKGYQEFIAQADLQNLNKYSSAQVSSIKLANDWIKRLEPYYLQAVEDSTRKARELDSLNNLNQGKKKKKKSKSNSAFVSPVPQPVYQVLATGFVRQRHHVVSMLPPAIYENTRNNYTIAARLQFSCNDARQIIDHQIPIPVT